MKEQHLNESVLWVLNIFVGVFVVAKAYVFARARLVCERSFRYTTGLGVFVFY